MENHLKLCFFPPSFSINCITWPSTLSNSSILSTNGLMMLIIMYFSPLFLFSLSPVTLVQRCFLARWWARKRNKKEHFVIPEVCGTNVDKLCKCKTSFKVAKTKCKTRVCTLNHSSRLRRTRRVERDRLLHPHTHEIHLNTLFNKCIQFNDE